MNFILLYYIIHFFTCLLCYVACGIFKNFIIYLWLHLIVVAVPASSSCASRHSRCGGFSCGARALEHAASVVVGLALSSTGSAAVAHGLSCPVTCTIFPAQGSNLYSGDLICIGGGFLNHWTTREVGLWDFQFPNQGLNLGP